MTRSKRRREYHIMMNNNQKQIAGNNSQQQQATTINNYNLGITEERARTIFYELFNTQRKDLTQEASHTALERISRFEKDLMPKIAHVEGALEAFADPGFQIQLAKAHRAAASSGRDGDYKMLSELIKYRIENPSNRTILSSISHSIDIIDNIDDAALCALAVVYVFHRITFKACDLEESIEKFDNFLGHISYLPLPTDSIWIEHLNILNIIRIETFGSFTPPLDILHNRYNGFICAGIKIGSKENNRAIQILVENNLDPSFLVPNNIIDGYLRLNILNQSQISDLYIVKNIDGQIHERKIADNEIKAFQDILQMYTQDKDLIETAKEHFNKMIYSKKNISKAIEFLNTLKPPYSETIVGKTIIHCFLRQFNSDIPML
uniref:Uncharacterized protein n=1 Tax=Myoviridae sp. ctWaE18 TaxID=2826662 RepID=A0A8S5MY16_9CAUD|nr:MAG TPA: hypothetical protein [Myoviridae sp. ctWaE18]